ncbi:hypothetical protein [Streptomyces purpureus]|uniref:Uncharacterized protein n=1 Tax=Streptomyces purpureus TaxID=1951 RepID=A0A918H327_9ACTN|nr:hypothetical protein [Streptomyces purpureus]GGT32466.1 hypothetical protein GCM10014713_27660 [Streptomyces purpureus]
MGEARRRLGDDGTPWRGLGRSRVVTGDVDDVRVYSGVLDVSTIQQLRDNYAKPSL